MNSIHIKIRDSQPGENSINSIYTIKQLKSKTGQKNDKYSMISWSWHRNCYNEKLFRNILRGIKKVKKKMNKINILLLTHPKTQTFQQILYNPLQKSRQWFDIADWGVLKSKRSPPPPIIVNNSPHPTKSPPSIQTKGQISTQSR